MKKRIYMGCALTQSPTEFRVFAENFRVRLERLENVELLKFIGLENGTARDVVEHDLDCVRACDAMVALVEYPSIGLGMELQVAIDLKKPVLCLYDNAARVTRMLHGYEEMGRLRLLPYPTTDWAFSFAKKFIKSI